MLLQRRSSDEYRPLDWSKRDLWAVERAVERAEAAGDTIQQQYRFSVSRRGTATALRAIDQAWGGGYIDFLVYHSGYETPVGDEEEGPYDQQAPAGTDRLIKSLDETGIGPGGNVYAELGSTWYVLLRRPREAAHVIGKLLNAVGEDNVLWGSDSIWYGSPQPLIDAFRAFQIPEDLRQRYGYPELTSHSKEKILGLNAARVYGIDPSLTRSQIATDDLSWVKAAFDEYIDKNMFQ